MTTRIILLVVSLVISITGLLYKLSLRGRNRKLRESNTDRPGELGTFNHLIGGFRYNNVTIYYQVFSLYGLPFIPIDCFSAEVTSNVLIAREFSVYGSQPWRLLEVLVLYSRWGWVAAFVNIMALLQEAGVIA